MPAFVSLLIVVTLALSAWGEERRDYPFAPVPFTQVKVSGGFWGPRFETNRTVTLWYDFKKCEETARIANFARAGKLEQGKFEGIPFNDSDVFKVVEGAAYLLALQPDPKLDAYLDDLIKKFAAAQEPDGYLYTARTLGHPDVGFMGKERWTRLQGSHELYNVGHLYEAAVAHFLATGKRTLLDVALKNADLICKVFGPEPGQRIEVPGHEEVEIGLVKLYRVTGDEKYLKLAKFFIETRGRSDMRKTWGANLQDHKPFREQDEAVGHAVRAGYFYSGAVDVAALTGDEPLLKVAERLWEDVVSRKLHLTGGIGARHGGEAFGDGYELPNASAYLETCAAIANALWNERLFLAKGDAKYVDVLERTIYNGFLAGVSLSGDRFFYPNPLASDGHSKFNHGSNERQAWFGCSCCPVNVVRFIPSIAGYVYATRGEALYVNLFVNSDSRIQLPAGKVALKQETNYPWDGRIKLAVDPERDSAFTVKIRIPGWAQGRPLASDLYRYEGAAPAAPPKLTVNGEAVQAKPGADGYASIARTWKKGDVVEMNLPMPARRVVAHEKVKDCVGRVAIERGPLVYCVEGADHEGRALQLMLPEEIQLAPEHHADLLGGVTVLTGQGQAAVCDAAGQVASQPVKLTMIPYYAWCHRGPNEMNVWLPRSMDGAVPLPTPTLATQSRISFSHHWPSDNLTALNDQVLPKSSLDHDVPRFTWWDHRGTSEWVQYDFAASARVAGVEVYWFDDTGRGQCRVPKSWKVLYSDGDAWKDVRPGGEYGTARDQFNGVNFEPVETKALRIEVQLQPDASGGILEWRLTPAK